MNKKFLKIGIFSFFLMCISIFFIYFAFAKEKNRNIVFIAKAKLSKNSLVSSKSIYETAFKKVSAGKLILEGEHIKTKKGSSVASLSFSDRSIIRLNEGTEIVINKINRDFVSVTLKKGEIWINNQNTPFEVISSDIKMVSVFGEFDIKFNSKKKKNNIKVFRNYASLSFIKGRQIVAKNFLVPANNKITVYDSQITNDYKTLEYTKLKKELKMRVFDMGQINNWENDNVVLDNNSKNDFLLKNFTSSFQKLAYFKAKRNLTGLRNLFIYAKTKKIEEKKDNIADLLNEIDNLLDSKNSPPVYANLINNLKNKCSSAINKNKIISLLNKKLDTIKYAIPTDKKYQFKTDLEKIILNISPNKEKPDLKFSLLKDSLREIDSLFYSHANINIISKSIYGFSDTVKKWHKDLNLGDFISVYRLFHNLFVIHIEKINNNFIVKLTELEGLLLKRSKNENISLEIGQNRLILTDRLISEKKYTEAKDYLTESFKSLNLENSPSAFVDFLQKQAKLIDEKLEYAINNLHGTGTLDKKAFSEFRKQKEDLKKLNKEFRKSMQAIKKIGQKTNKSVDIKERINLIANRFYDSGVFVSANNIAPLDKTDKDPYLFKIDETSYKGEKFSANYDFSANSVYNLKLIGKDKKFITSIPLENLGEVIKYKKQSTAAKTNDTTEKNLTSSQQERIERQIIQKIVQNELLVWGIEAETENIKIIDKKNKIYKIYKAITDEEKNNDYNFDFVYNAKDKTVSNIIFPALNEIEKQETVIEKLKEFITEKSIKLGNLIAAKKEIKKEFSDNKIDISEKDIEIQQENIRLKPVSSFYNAKEVFAYSMFSGTYNSEKKVFSTISIGNVSLKNIDIAKAAEMIAKTYIRSLLMDNNINIPLKKILVQRENEIYIMDAVFSGEEISFIYVPSKNIATKITIRRTLYPNSISLPDLPDFVKKETIKKPLIENKT